MKTILKLTPAIAAVALLSACGATMEQRAATGAIGGAVAGQAIGAAAGAATTPRRPN